MQLCASYSYSWTTPSFYTKQNQTKWESFTQKWCETGRNRLSSAVLGVRAIWSLRSYPKKHSLTLWYFTMDLHLFFSPVIHGNQKAQCKFSSSWIYLAWFFESCPLEQFHQHSRDLLHVQRNPLLPLALFTW